MTPLFTLFVGFFLTMFGSLGLLMVGNTEGRTQHWGLVLVTAAFFLLGFASIGKAIFL